MVKDCISDKLFRHSPDMICIIGQDGRFMKVSDASRHILGYDSRELENRTYIDFVHPDDKANTLQKAYEIQQGKPTTAFENRYIRKDGKAVSLAWAARWTDEDGVFFCTVRDNSAQHNLRKKLYEKEAFYQALIEHGSDMLGLLDKAGNYLFVSGAFTRILGYSSEELIGTSAFNLIHPEDLPNVYRSWASLGTKNYIKSSDFRYKAANGEWRWIDAIVSDQLQNPAINAYVLSSRDITERKLGRLKLEESEQRYRALFENNPDIVIIENTDGVITDVNQAFRNTFLPDSEKIIGCTAATFLSPDMAAVNERSLREALLGSTLRYDLEYTTRNNKLKILDTVKFPVTVNGKIVGAQTILKDITPIVQSYETIERQAKKLNTIFESITDAFFTLDKNWHYTYVNSEFERITGAKEQEYVGKHLLDVSEYGAEGVFYKQYLHATKTGESVHFEAYSDKLNKWLEVKAFPSEEGLSVYFTDVTERVKAQKEVEKLSLVASNTDNGVIITDAAGVTEWVNEGFTRITGYTMDEMVGKKPGEVLQGPETDQETVKEIRKNIQLRAHFNTQLVNYNKSGEKFWMSMDLTPIFSDYGVLSHYIAIQRDITLLKETETNLLYLTQDLYARNKDLQEFTYIVSHNLRAPVANALGLANLLTKADQRTEDSRLAFSYLKSSILKMDTVLKDVNMILSIRNKQDVLEVEDVKLADVFWQAYAQLQEPTLLCGGEVELNFSDDLVISANRASLFSIFYNLLSNAIKFRSVKRQLKIQVGYDRTTDGSAVLSFSDNGTGFDTEKAGNDVFKLYKRFHRDKKGRGMGLFLVKAHVEAMGWQIKVDSQVDTGTKFLIFMNKN